MVDQFDDGHGSVWGSLRFVIGHRYGPRILHPRRLLLLEAKGMNGHRSECPDSPKGLPSLAMQRAACKFDPSARRGVHGCDWTCEYDSPESFAIVPRSVPRSVPRAKPMGQTTYYV